MKMLINTTNLTMLYQFNIMEFDITNKIKMLDNDHIITILIYLRFSEEVLRYPL